MTEKKTQPEMQQEIRVIDRRAFTPDGERRSPDANTVEESSAPIAVPSLSGGSDGAPVAGPSGSGEPIPSPLFQNLLLTLAQQAASHLGAGPSPIGGQIEVDFEAAQQMIDLLDALQQKTLGNLTQDEKEMLRGLIGELQMQFVTVRSKAPGTS